MPTSRSCYSFLDFFRYNTIDTLIVRTASPGPNSKIFKQRDFVWTAYLLLLMLLPQVLIIQRALSRLFGGGYGHTSVAKIHPPLFAYALSYAGGWTSVGSVESAKYTRFRTKVDKCKALVEKWGHHNLE